MDAKSRLKPARSRKHRAAQRKREVAAGIPLYIDGDVVRKHLASLTAIGMTPAMIGRAAGVAPVAVRGIIAGRSAQVRRRQGAAILNVDHRPHPNQAFCLAIGARRRVQALGVLGWPAASIADHMGVTVSNLRNTLGRTVIAYTSWSAVRDAYEELSGKRGPSKEAAVAALALGYQPPLDWDTVDIDDPRVTPEAAPKVPDVAEIAERRKEVARLTRAGLTAQQIADRLSVDPRTVVRDRTARRAA